MIKYRGVVMAGCEFMQKCALLNDSMTHMPSTSLAIRLRYCHTETPECARYYVCKSQGMEGVPYDLFPNQFEVARMIFPRDLK